MRCHSLVILCAVLVLPAAVDAAEIDFNRDVRPILSNNCLLCHGPDDSSLEAGLRLDSREIAIGELESGEIAIVPGKPDMSELIARIAADDESIRMPPVDHGAKLSDEAIATLRQWIAEGAEYAQHWSYAVPQRPSPPAPPEEFRGWIRNPIDNFSLRRMLEHNLRPSPEADRHALVRRVFLDLTGLPPTIEEADAFVASKNPNAYEELVDELLRRPAFGEHWARKWLDLARYADSAGYADDPPRTIWAYRDWVIRAMNDNMPFDQFTREQLAGDLLPNATQDQLIATAFHRNTLTNNEGGTQDEEFRNVAVVDRVNTTMAVWMGTTMACAQCHSHKYDPITQDEYFQFFAIFNNTEDADRRDESPKIEIFTDEQVQQKQQLQEKIEQLEQQLATSTPELAKAQSQWEARLREAPRWQPLVAKSASRSSKLPIQLGDRLLATESADNDTTTVLLPIASGTEIAALRLETLPDAALPGKGAGLSGGNFVITSVSAELVPAEDTSPDAQFVRITNNGKKQILSLAEVQVFSDGENIAPMGEASQHSVDFGGPPQHAIDGNTDGNYEKQSVTHTKTVDNPWWELDLKAEHRIERIAVWNRTDNQLHARLKDFTIELLDEDRQVLWSRTIQDAPNPSSDFAPSSIRSLTFSGATADYHQPGFEPAAVLRKTKGNAGGWAVGGALNDPHQLVLSLEAPLQVKDASTLRVIIGQDSPHKGHLLGSFRLSATGDATAIERSSLPQRLLDIVDKPKGRGKEAAAELAAYYRSNVALSLATTRAELAAVEKRLTEMKAATSVPILREKTANLRKTHLQYRGNYLDKGKELTAGLPSVFYSGQGEASPIDRLALADWLVNAENPLTGRVLANRYWESILGRGIVVTSEEFGSQGELPTHPQLLDWLATELVRNGWDRKALLRLLVTSATYRQAARVEAGASDVDNRWLARGPRVRLTAEMVRDQALLASGLLSTKMFGPPVRPPQPNMGLTAAFGGSTDWKTSQGEDRYRRGLYTTWRRSNPYPSMATFDAPNREVCTVRRNRTNTPLQSLVTLNDPVYVEAAQSLARIALSQDGSLDEQVAHAFRRCVLRPPSDAEVSALRALFLDSQRRLEGKEAEAMSLATEPLGALPEGLSVIDAAAMTVVCNVMLNLDEMFLKR